jgi:hypothetical protein
MMDFILEMVRTFIEFCGYVAKFAILLAICWGISILIPLSCFEVSILMMIYWFLNLYNRSK